MNQIVLNQQLILRYQTYSYSILILPQKMEMTQKDQLISKRYYRPSDLQVGCCSSTFDLRFQQMKNSYLVTGFFSKIQALKIRRNFQKKSIPHDLQQLQQKLPINYSPHFQCQKDKIRYTWIGHSTAVISIGNQANILIDPVFSERCSPFKNYGPKRFRQTPCKIHQLPKIDIVLVSHDHYDHLDSKSLDELQKLYHPQFCAGLRSQILFPKNCKMNQFDWTQTKKIVVNGYQFQITFVPVVHWSRRHFMDLCKRLWGGFVIKTPNGSKIFFAGDTGYFQPLFQQIGEAFGGFDLSILPIGAYEPRILLKNQHFNPQDAVLCHKNIKSKKSVGVHWGTFPLGYEHWCGARQDLKRAGQKHNLKEDEFITVGHGESFEIDYKQK